MSKGDERIEKRRVTRNHADKDRTGRIRPLA